MQDPFIAARSVMWKGTRTGLLAVAALLCAMMGARAGELQIAGANSDGNSVYDLSQSSSGLITGVSALNTDASSHGSFASLVWVPDAATGSLDLIVADPKKQQIVRYSGPKYGKSSTLYSWAGLGKGPAEPRGLSVDTAGDLFVVSSTCGSDPRASLWVIPVNSKASTGYGAPLLVDNSFNGVKTAVLAETLVAGTTTELWNAGDLVVLVGDSSDARVIVYAQKKIAGVIANPNTPLSGPTSTAISWAKFQPQWAVPLGMAEWPADAKHGPSLLITTVDGRILRFDTSADTFDAVFATVGTGLEKIKTGLSASVPYAFVSQVLSNNQGQIFQFGAPPANGAANKPVATVSHGVSAPIGLAVTSSGSTTAASCVSPNPACTFFDGALTVQLSGPGAKNVSGNILEQACEVQSDPRVTVAGTAWSCNGKTLDVSTLCPGFPSTILPGTLCGHSGPTGAGFVVLKGTADGIDPVDNNTEITLQSNINAILPGPLNQNCNPAAAFAWAPRSDLAGVEGTIVEDALTPYFIDITGFCDEPAIIVRGASMTSFGIAVNAAALPTGLPGYVDAAYTNLSSEVTAASAGITPTVEANLQTYISNSKSAFDSGVAGAADGYTCADYWDVFANSYILANSTAFTSTLTPTGGNPNIPYDASGRLAHLYLLIQEASGNAVNTTYPPASVPPCVTLTASPPTVPAGTAATLSWTGLGVPAGSSCTLSGGAFTNKTEAASGSVSTGNLAAAGSPYTFELVCPGTASATGFATAVVNVTPATTAPVPNVVGLSQTASLPAAQTSITNAGFKLGTVTTQSSATVPAGNVISQSPAAGSALAKGQAINLVVSTGPSVPNVVGDTQAAATTAITTAGLALGTVTSSPSATVASGRVISQTPAAGTAAAIGSKVNIVLSTGPAVPNVVGDTQAAATTAITAAGLTLGTVTSAPSATVASGLVISETPAAGTSVAAGSKVNIVLSTGPAAVGVPNIVGDSPTAAQTALSAKGFTLGSVTGTAPNDSAVGTILSQTPAAGITAATGTAVTVTESSGVPNVVGLSQAAATSAISGIAGFSVGTITQALVPGVTVGNVVVQSPVGGTSPTGATVIALTVSGVEVPSYVGQTVPVSIAGLTVGTTTPQASSTVASGAVISQIPAGGSVVAGGTAVNFIVSSGAGTVTVPNIVGGLPGAAQTALSAKGLTLGSVTGTSPNDSAVGTILSQIPAASSTAAAGTAVTVTESSGVPNVVGLSQAAAISTINGITGFSVGTTTQALVPNSTVGNVVIQSPVGGTSANGATVIALTISGVEVPNYYSQSVPGSITGLAVGTTTYQQSSSVPYGEVISQTPTAGSIVAGGTTVNFAVSGVQVQNYVGTVPGSIPGLIVGTPTFQASGTVTNGAVISQSLQAGSVVASGTTVNFVVSSGPTASINSFSAENGGNVPYGYSAALDWNANADSCTLTVPNVSEASGLSAQNSGYATDYLTQTGQQNITLSCTGGGTTVSQTISVTVGPAPTINTFTASPTGLSYTTGSQALLTWTTSNEPDGQTCQILATDGTYATQTPVPLNGATLDTGAVFTGAFTFALPNANDNYAYTNNYTATLTCPYGENPYFSTTATLNLNVNVPTPLDYPQGMAVAPSGNLYVTSYLQNGGGAVLVYAPSPSGMIQQTALTLSTIKNGEASATLQNPVAVTFDTAGNLYILDSSNEQIYVVSLSAGGATLMNTLTIPTDNYNCATGIAVDKNYNLYVTCNANGDGTALYVYTPSNPQNPRSLPSSWNGPITWTGDATNGAYTNLYGVAIDGTGTNLLVGVSYDTEESEVVSYALSDLQNSTANSGQGGSTTNLPLGLTIQPPAESDPNAGVEAVNIAVDSSSNIYVATTYVDQNSILPTYPYTIASYTSGGTLNTVSQNTGNYLGAVTAPPNSQSGAPPALTEPGGLAIDGSGNLYVSDTTVNTVDVYSATSGAYQYDFLPIIALTATQTNSGDDEGSSYVLNWTSFGVELFGSSDPTTSQCYLTVYNDGSTSTGVGSSGTATLDNIYYFQSSVSCPGAIVQVNTDADD